MYFNFSFNIMNETSFYFVFVSESIHLHLPFVHSINPFLSDFFTLYTCFHSSPIPSLSVLLLFTFFPRRPFPSIFLEFRPRIDEKLFVLSPLVPILDPLPPHSLLKSLYYPPIWYIPEFSVTFLIQGH